MPWKPELLAPAKNLERLKIAVHYGADAVYVGGQRYGLRARADNLTDTELEAAVAYAHAYHARVYVTLNAFLHDEDFAGFGEHCRFLEAIGVDAVIVSDLGVLRQVQAHSALPIHLSTQASCLNVPAAKMWKQQGVERLILGRELTLEEGGMLRQAADIDVEMFIHGAMCMAFSGRCTISNFTAGRDSNRGGCAQSCRFPYSIQPQNSKLKPPVEPQTLLSSKDLWGVRQISRAFAQRICSLKIEGRMKSALYVATVCRVYRALIDAYAAGSCSEALLAESERALQTVPHRDLFSGSLEAPAGPDSVFEQPPDSTQNVGTHEGAGIVIDATPTQLVLRLSKPLSLGDPLEFLPFRGAPINWHIEALTDVVGTPLTQARQDHVVCIPRVPALQAVERLNVLRIPHATAPGGSR